MTNFKSNPENKAAVLQIVAMLVRCSTGSFVSYQDIQTATKRDVQNEYRWLLQSAVRKAEKQTGSRYACLVRMGIKRLHPDEIPGLGVLYLTKARRAASRGAKRLSNIKDNMTPETQRKVNAYRSHLGAIALIAKNEETKRVEEKTEPESMLSIGSTLAMFAAKSRK